MSVDLIQGWALAVGHIDGISVGGHWALFRPEQPPPGYSPVFGLVTSRERLLVAARRGGLVRFVDDGPTFSGQLIYRALKRCPVGPRVRLGVTPLGEGLALVIADASEKRAEALVVMENREGSPALLFDNLDEVQRVHPVFGAPVVGPWFGPDGEGPALVEMGYQVRGTKAAGDKSVAIRVDAAGAGYLDLEGLDKLIGQLEQARRWMVEP